MDDIVLISNKIEELKEMMVELNSKSKEMGLTINFSKTKAITNGGEEDILVDGQKIEFVSEYKYLGQIVAMEHRTRKEMRVRTANAWGNFWANKNVFKK